MDHKANKMRYWKIIIVIFGIPLFFFVISHVKPPKETFNTLISPLATTVAGAKTFIAKVAGQSKLKNLVDSALQGTHGTYGIVIKNLTTGETYSQNEHMEFDSASLYKLWVLGAVYERLNKGTLKKSDILSQKVEDLNEMFEIASDSAELTDGTITLSVEDAIEKMITISDNYAALLLASKIKNTNIASFIQGVGLLESSLGQPPQTTPNDIAIFYEKIYRGEMINKNVSSEILDVLKRQELNDRIPKYLPDGVDIAHKTGELDGAKHDAGIIFAKDPILVVLMSNSDDPLAAAEREALLSKAIYDYFN